MNADGSGQSRLTRNSAEDSQPSWSPDGRRITFASDRDDQLAEIYVMNADGTEQRRLTSNDSVDDNPAWSPDGTTIAIHSRRNFHEGIYLIDVTSGDVRQVTSNSNDNEPAWSPDGTRLAIASHLPLVSDRCTDIFIVEVSSAQRKQVTDNTNCDYEPSWSSDGTRIAFTSTRTTGNEYHQDIFSISIDGSGETRLTNEPNERGANWYPAWSPDSQRIAFTSNRGVGRGFANIFLMSKDGSSLVPLTSERTALNYDPDWH